MSGEPEAGRHPASGGPDGTAARRLPGMPAPLLAEGNPPGPADPAEAAAVERALARLEAPLAPGAERSRLLPALHALQAEQGWLSRGALQHLADRLGLPFPDVWGVATFYALFRMTPPRGVAVQVCDDVPCLLRGAGELLGALEGRWGPVRRFDGEAHTARGHGGGAAGGHGGDGAPDGTPATGAPADLEAVPCLGQCDGAPAVRVAGRLLRCAAFDAVIAAAAQAAAAQGVAAAGPDGGRGGGERRG